jgi:hypothetical protein
MQRLQSIVAVLSEAFLVHPEAYGSDPDKQIEE